MVHVYSDDTSLQTAANAVKLFPRIFSDSNVARSIQLNIDKVSYTIHFGLTPFFQEKLLNYFRQLRFFTVSFDESEQSYPIQTNGHYYYILVFRKVPSTHMIFEFSVLRP